MATETRDFALEAGKQSTPKKAKVTFANTAPPASNEPRRIVYRLAWEHYRYPGAVPTAGYGTTLYASRRDANNKIVEKYNASEDPKIKSMRHGMDLAGNFWSAIHFKEIPGVKHGPEHIKRFVEEVSIREVDNHEVVESTGEAPLQWIVNKQ